MHKPKVYISKTDATVFGLQRPTPVEIVCGDCSSRIDEAGNVELLPLRTRLTMDGRCHTCGGRSFVIASELCGALCRTIMRLRHHNFTEEFPAGTQQTRETGREIWDGAEARQVLSKQPKARMLVN